jgi:hypothetical protein
MTPPELRASDADRERTAERLRAAAGEGRLSAEELEARLETALSGRTYAELEGVVADLPESGRPAPPTPRRAELRAFAATSALLVAIWALTGMGYFWPVWPILGWGVFVVGPVGARCARRAHPRAAQVGFGACRRNAS